MKLSVREELRGKRLSLIRAEMRSSSGVPDERQEFSEHDIDLTTFDLCPEGGLRQRSL